MGNYWLCHMAPTTTGSKSCLKSGEIFLKVSNINGNSEEIIIYSTADGKANISLLAKDGSVRLNQNQLAELFATSRANISTHISNIFEDKELQENSVVKFYLTTAADGKDYNVAYYSLDMILAIGFRVRSRRGTQFRQWANRNLVEFMRKGFIIDDERLKNPDGRPDYFDELLERIREIRASEKSFSPQVFPEFSVFHFSAASPFSEAGRLQIRGGGGTSLALIR